MRIQTAEHLGHMIRERRIQNGLGQQSLASLVGVGRQWISEIEQGKPRAEVGLILKTLRALGLELDVTSTSERVAMSTDPTDGPEAVVSAARHCASSAMRDD